MTVAITWELPDGQLQAIEFDAVVRDSHESTSEATEHPVEDGAVANDHIRRRPDRVTLECVVSNTPTRVPATQMDGTTGALSGVTISDAATGLVLAKASALVFSGEFDRVRTVYDELLRLKNSGTLVGIITSLRDYQDMALLRVSPVREASTGNMLVATVEAQQFTIVSTEIVDSPSAEPEENRARGNRNRGRQNNSESDSATDSRNRSYMVQIADSVTNFFGGSESAPPPP